MDRANAQEEAVELAESTAQHGQRLQTEVETETPLNMAMYIKLMSAGLSFFVAGVNDGSLGALIPYLINSYHIDTAMVAIVYAVTFLGWFVAAITNSHLCQVFDLGLMLTIGAILQVVAQALRSWLPPFSLYAVTFGIASLGQAYQDTHCNTFVASVKAAHRWLGFIHAMYMAGCLVGPLVATAVASSRSPSPWNLFYTFPLGLGLINLLLVLFAFRDSVRLSNRTVAQDLMRLDASAIAATSNNQRALEEIKKTLRVPGVWLLSLFYFFYLGTAITAVGWVVEYLVVVRKGNLADMGYVPAGFSGGGFLGRLLLAEPTHRFGERRMLLIYSVLCLALQLVFWLVPNIIAASVVISVMGFFLGPFFAAGVSVGSKLFHSEIRSSALVFIFVLGQIGGSIFPAVTGIIAAHAGVEILQPVLVGLLAATAISWALVPRKPTHHQD